MTTIPITNLFIQPPLQVVEIILVYNINIAINMPRKIEHKHLILNMLAYEKSLDVCNDSLHKLSLYSVLGWD
jgi:hypothetical protein